MAKVSYSIELCRDLQKAAANPELHFLRRPVRYEEGERLRVRLSGIHPVVEAEANFVLEKFLGGGFAGQVYRARLESLVGEGIRGLVVGEQYAVKIIVPPSRLSTWFRDTVFKLGFQGPFSSRVNEDACRAGLLQQLFIRHACRFRFGRETAVKDAYATFWDERLGSYGEVTEWIEGRCWHLEADRDLPRRWGWRTVPLDETASAEYVATRRFMAEMVRLLHDMGMPEFARQYEWWTMKSQPNVMLRTDIESAEPGDTLCAVDFRAGLALLACLPMSPGDILLIGRGLFKRGALVQFDRCDVARLREFVSRNSDSFSGIASALEELEEHDQGHRRSLPDVTRRGFLTFLRAADRAGLAKGQLEGWRAEQLLDGEFAGHLRGMRFLLFLCLGLVPFLGGWVRRLWGNTAYRQHVGAILRSTVYRRRALRASAAGSLVRWLRAGRCSEDHAEYLRTRPWLFTLERFTLGLCPIAIVHRVALRPARIWRRIVASWSFIRSFWTCEAFREAWFLAQIDEGEQDGMLTAAEAEDIRLRVRDPFIVKYLKCVAVHFATLPITQIVSVVVAGVLAGTIYARSGDWAKATGVFAATLAFFQVIPISPGSICRGVFVLWVMARERNWRDYVIACPLSFAKYIGYLAFPLQMTTTYPVLARFLTARWAIRAVHVVPVFGERGALLEHWVFDCVFNVPQMVARWAKPRLGALLWLWAFWGCGGTALLLRGLEIEVLGKLGINIFILAVCIFVLPRALFYPVLLRRMGSGTDASSV
ncbi:MAG: hypothetical protein KAI66_11810 [Lentisphaeria bacterium]|nr:hypothetical protein [Lentisphaeria bacterium]